MTAMIKLYTWWTIRGHKKSDQQVYKLVAVTRRNPVSGADRNQLKDTLEVSPVSDETAWKKMKSGAVIYGLLPAKFAFDFKFDSIRRNTVPGVFKAEMRGVFSLNFDDPDGLGGFLTLLPELCKNGKNEWSDEDLKALLEEYEPLIEEALKARVNSNTVTSSDLLGKGDSWTPTEEEKAKVFPPWLKVSYLHAKFTYSEADLHGAQPENEEAKSVQDEHLKWEEEYNKKVEDFERRTAERELQQAIEIKELDFLTQDHVLVLAKAEEQRKFFRSKHPELGELLDIWSTWRRKTFVAYAIILFWMADHPIVSPIVLIAALLAYNYVANAYIPLRVQIKIDGNNDSAAKIMKDAIRKHFASVNAEFIKGKRTNLTFSDKDGGRITNEFLLERENISHFEESLENFVYNNQDCIDGKYRSLPDSYSLFDGGINFMLKKKVYTFTVKDNTVVRSQEVILSGNNSIGRDLKTFLARQYAEGGAVDDSRKKGNDTVFSFKLRSGITADELKKGISAKFAVRVTGNDPLVVDARQKGATTIILNVKNLGRDGKVLVGKIFGHTILDETSFEITMDREKVGETIEKAGLAGRWEGNTYVFEKPVYHFEITWISSNSDNAETMVKEMLKDKGNFANASVRKTQKVGSRFSHTVHAASYLNSVKKVESWFRNFNLDPEVVENK